MHEETDLAELRTIHDTITRPKLPVVVRQPNLRFSDGSFSAVSKPIFATKYSFFSIFLKALQDLETFAPLQIQNLQIFAFSFCNFLGNPLDFIKCFVENCYFSLEFSRIVAFGKCYTFANLARSYSFNEI